MLDYRNENIKKFSVDEENARNSLLIIDSSIDENFNLGDEFDVSDEGKELSSLKNVRRNDRTPITNMSDAIVNREIFSNDISKIKRYKFS